MIRPFVLLLGSSLLVGLHSGAAAGDTPANALPPGKKDATEPYAGFKADQALLRKHLIHKDKDGGKDTRASSEEACQAAQCIFTRLPFMFRTREEVLDLLGDPKTVSDYNDPAGKEPSSPLVYVFDTGFGGLKYTISFGQLDRLRVTRVEVEGQD